MKHIGIVCEGPTDFVILSRVIDTITKELNCYLRLQPEENCAGQYGNGWKGVLKWCRDHADIKNLFMQGVAPALDFLVIQMDGDVSRKDKPSHCLCASVMCEKKIKRDPLNYPIDCDTTTCPVVLPCEDHAPPVDGYRTHLKGLIAAALRETDRTCIVIPCDSTEAWVIAAYDSPANVEQLEAPWENVIARGKSYHGIRIPGQKKRARIFEEFAPVVCENWEKVKQLCQSAQDFEQSIHTIVAAASQ